MNIVDQKTIIKRIAKAWKEDRYNYEKATDKIERDLLGISMLTNRYSLEYCGLTLEEIITFGHAPDLNEAIDDLFSEPTNNNPMEITLKEIKRLHEERYGNLSPKNPTSSDWGEIFNWYKIESSKTKK